MTRSFIKLSEKHVDCPLQRASRFYFMTFLPQKALNLSAFSSPTLISDWTVWLSSFFAILGNLGGNKGKMLNIFLEKAFHKV